MVVPIPFDPRSQTRGKVSNLERPGAKSLDVRGGCESKSHCSNWVDKVNVVFCLGEGSQDYFDLFRFTWSLRAVYIFSGCMSICLARPALGDFWCCQWSGWHLGHKQMTWNPADVHNRSHHPKSGWVQCTSRCNQPLRVNSDCPKIIWSLWESEFRNMPAV